jgi:uroporphyrinogen decarboxylase
MSYVPDYRHFADVMKNKRPERLPLYEHVISTSVMEKILGESFAALMEGDSRDRAEYFRQYCRFFKEMTYDTVSHEVGIIGTLPGETAIHGGQGPIQTRADFESYPWAELPARYWKMAGPRVDALVAALPPL